MTRITLAVALGWGLLATLPACTPTQLAKTQDAIDVACVVVPQATKALSDSNPSNPDIALANTLASTSCAAKDQLRANDQAPVTPSNSGNSAKWLLNNVLPLAIQAAAIGVKVAPLFL